MFGKQRILAAVLMALAAVFWVQQPAAAQAYNVTVVALDDTYHLGPGDELKVAVFNEAELSGTFTVAESGTIDYPLVGNIMARGLTMAEFAAAVSEKIKAYVLEPKVTVEIGTYRPFFILGEVGKPGTYPYSANLTVMNAIATAGGFTYRANKKKVFIKRANNAQEQEYSLKSSPTVTPGDTLRIPERRF